MTGVERIQRALIFEMTDRVPVLPELIQHNLEVAGKRYGEFCTKPDIMRDVILAGFDAYKTDAVYVSSDNYIIAETMGGEVRIYEDEPPALYRRAADSVEAAVKLPVLCVEKGRIPVILKATELLKKELGDDIFIKACIDSAPFSAAAAILGPEVWMIGLLETPILCHEFLENCTESVIRYGLAAAQAGAHGLAFGDSPAGLVSRSMYEKFALPYAQRVIDVLHKKTGLPVFYHICGNSRHILDLMVSTGADCIEIDSVVPMSLAREVSWKKCAVEGNVSTIEALLQGTPEKVIQESYAILDLYGRGGGLILGSACEVPRYSPQRNVGALIEAAKSYPYK